jgi:hypothetical protein
MASETGIGARVVHAANLLDAWHELRPLYARRCDPGTLELLRHAFYLGALGAFSILVHGGADDDASDAGVARIDAMHEELRSFQYDLRRVAGGER